MPRPILALCHTTVGSRMERRRFAVASLDELLCKLMHVLCDEWDAILLTRLDPEPPSCPSSAKEPS